MVDGFAGCIEGQLVQRGREGQWQQPGNAMASERQERLGEPTMLGVLGYKHVTLGQHPSYTDDVGPAYSTQGDASAPDAVCHKHVLFRAHVRSIVCMLHTGV